MNAIGDPSLSGIPTLVLFDKIKTDMESENEKLRNQINSKENINVNFQHINFEKGLGDLRYGLEWISEVSKPI
jgi:hypothetical protein